MSINYGTLTGYIYEDSLRSEANRIGENYWYAYMEEIMDEMGLRAAKLTRGDLSDPGRIAALRYLFIGDFTLSVKEKAALREWVQAGGTLIGFATIGADDLFAIEPVGRWKQADGPFTIAAYYRFNAAGVPADPQYGFHGAMVPILSPEVILLGKEENGAFGSLLQVAWRRDTGHEAIARRTLGNGQTYYFGFNLPHSIWAMHQGRPVDRDYDGDGLYRFNDAVVFSRSIGLDLPVADYWLQFLETILIQTPQPFLHQLPPLKDGTLPDMLFHIGGDDECTPGIQVKSSDYFKEKGLPYQINLMPDRSGKFAIDKEEYEAIKQNGHDPSLHFDFVGQYRHYNEADMKRQLDQYLEAFGEVPVATVNHCSMATGWAEQARWASALGMRGDNTRVHSFVPPDNGINLMGFGFGTCYPHFVYDDYKHDNKRLDYVNIPIVFFEPRIYMETEEQDLARIRGALDRAAHFGWTLNLFIHPIYVVDEQHTPFCWPAVDEMLRYTAEKKYNVALHSTNQVCDWWFDRAASTVKLNGAFGTFGAKGSSASVSVKADHADGVFVKFPLNAGSSGEAVYTVDGRKRNAVVKRQNGIPWLFCQVPQGVHEIEVRFE
ncbi:hypothetical protein [Paenibacillus cymbidii]|uniref:hypothetical protein n=1 Tax=Paenibacillus cymbidii TaxID=1639034 RepID=UPI0010821C2C|nr:hypothetical protein [Paenibacillus cymbidii]